MSYLQLLYILNINNLVYITKYVSAVFVLSKKGKQMIKLNGYTYSSTPGVTKRKRWKCSTHQSRGCLASVHTVNDHIVLVKDTHTHEICRDTFKY